MRDGEDPLRVRQEQRVLLLVAQRDASVEEPTAADLYTIGTAAAVMRMLKLPDGRIRLLVQGLSRVKIESILADSPSLRAKVTRIPEPEAQTPPPEEVEALVYSSEIDKEEAAKLKAGDQIRVKVIKVDVEQMKIGVSARVQ